MPYYLAPYLGSGTFQDPFRPAGDPQKRIDLRPDPTEALGYAVAWHPTRLSDPRLDLIGEDADETPTVRTRRVLAGRLNLDADFTRGLVTLRDLIGGLLDPARAARLPWHPVAVIEATGIAEVHLGPLYWSANRRPIAGGATDNFNRANGALGSPWDYANARHLDIVSNTITADSAGAGNRLAWYTGAATSADQYSQVELVTLAGTSDFGPAVRCYQTSNNLNAYFYHNYTAQPGAWKVIDNSYTNIETTGWPTGAAGEVVRVSVEGSTIRGYIDGAEVAGSPATDTSITGVQQGPGIFYYMAGGALDNWAGGDLTAGLTLTANAGAYALTGTAASLRVERRLTADSGAAGITETAATLSLARRLFADDGAYVVTGTAASLTIQGQMYTFSVEPGSYALTGTAVSFRWLYRLFAAPGVITVTGTAIGPEPAPAPAPELELVAFPAFPIPRDDWGFRLTADWHGDPGGCGLWTRRWRLRGVPSRRLPQPQLEHESAGTHASAVAGSAGGPA